MSATSFLFSMLATVVAQQGQPDPTISGIPWEEMPDGMVSARYPGQYPVQILLSQPNDPITGVRVGLPLDNNDYPPDTSGYYYGFTHEAEVDGNGLVTVTLNDPGQFYVEITHLSGLVSGGTYLLGTLFADENDPRPPVVDGKRTEVLDPGSRAWVHSEDNIGGALCHANTVPNKFGAGGGSLGEVVAAVCEAFDDNDSEPVSLAFGSHGNEGQMNLGGVSNPAILSTDALALGQAIKGKVTSIEVYVCFGGAGASGAKMVTDLSIGACVPVCAWTGHIAYESGSTIVTSGPPWNRTKTRFPTFKLKKSGIKIVYPSLPQEIIGNNRVASPVLPICYAEGTCDPIAEIISYLGTDEPLWDIDNSGAVDEVDLQIVYDALGN